MSEKQFAKLIAKQYKKPWFRLSDLNLGIKGLEVYEASDESLPREDPFIPRKWILVNNKLFEHDQVDKAFTELKCVAKNEEDAIKIAKAMISILEYKVKFYPDFPGLKKPEATKIYGGYTVHIDAAVESAGAEFEKTMGRETKPKIIGFTVHVGIEGKYGYGLFVTQLPGRE